MKLVIKGPFTALRVNRALVGLPCYLPSSRMWFEKIEFKGVRWSLKWTACWSWSQGREETQLRGWRHWGAGALGLVVRGEGLPRRRAGGDHRSAELSGHPLSTLHHPPSTLHRCGRPPWCLAQGLQFFCLDSDVVMQVRNGVFQSHTQTPLGILLSGCY